MVPRLSLRNPLLTRQQISQSPSQQKGMSWEIEMNLRAYGCHLISSSGIVLRAPQVVMASAQILFHRFYFLASFQEFPLRGISLGCLFLASKVEEHPQSIRNIHNVLDIIVKRDRGYPEIVADGYDSEYYAIMNEMVIAEMQILRRLGFNVQVELPYGLLAHYLRSLELTEHDKVPQMAWNYLNDLLQTPVYVCFQPETIACGAILLAAQECQVSLPMDPLPWWEIFDANGIDVCQVARAAMALYRREQPRIMPLDSDELELYLGGELEKFVEEVRRDRWAAETKAKEPEQKIEKRPVSRSPSRRSRSPSRSRSYSSRHSSHSHSHRHSHRHRHRHRHRDRDRDRDRDRRQHRR